MNLARPAFLTNSLFLVYTGGLEQGEILLAILAKIFVEGHKEIILLKSFDR